METWSTLYPRPLLRRESFLCLNGPWQVNGQTVQVPYPPQSPLSGWQGEVPETLHYSRAFTLPEGFVPQGFHVRLHFGAADQVAQVFVNDRPAVQHEGGYLPFFADITALLRPGENTLKVEIMDALMKRYPYGKQKKEPGGMWYTPVSGLWQTVWLEAVPPHPVESIRVTPTLTSVSIRVETEAPFCRAVIHAPEGDISAVLNAGRETEIVLPRPRLWSPEDPFLYPMTVETAEEKVESRFALRTVGIREVNGRRWICLNDRPVFLHGVLDQGYFPEGVFLPETPEGYLKDIRAMKALGFNLLRKHIKVEPEVFYDLCDREGMLVLQDMVNSGGYSYFFDTVLPTIGLKKRPDALFTGGDRERKDFFMRHCLDTQRHLYNYPCVIGYTIFNEGWGQFESDRVYRALKPADPTRFYDSTSGWFAQKESDVDSEHIYFRNKVLKGRSRPLLLSECGGYRCHIEGHHLQVGKSWGYSKPCTPEQLTKALRELYEEMVLPSIPNGLCGCVVTQVSDVEGELNGLYTYNREVCKPDKAALLSLADRLQEALRKATEPSNPRRKPI